MVLLCFFHCYRAWPDRRRSAKELFFFSDGMFLGVYLEDSEFPPLLPTQTIGRQGPVVSLTIKKRPYG